ncbi:MAG: hypothetical protein ACERKZ_04120 [Lachnotalea sp.]
MINKVEKKSILLIVFLLAFCIIIFIGLIYWDISKVEDLGIINVDNDNSIVYSMPQTKQENGYTIIEGAYAFIPGEEIKTFNTYVVLQDVESKNCFKIPTINKKEEKINEDYISDIDYSNSGFSAYVKSNKLDFKNKKYQVLIWYGNDKHNSYVYTGIYID